MFQKTTSLIRFILRKDSFRIILWLIGLIFFTLIIPAALDDMFPAQEERDALAETMENPAMTALMGPADTSNYTLGVMNAHNMLLFTAIAVAIMGILLVIRNTRTEEEDGLSELILSLPVGRLANLNATFIVYTSVFIVLALISGFGLYALGLDSMGLEGSLLYGASLGATGIFFAGIAAIFAQVTESSRNATGLSIAFLLVAYLIRAVGDVGNETLSLFSPFGLVTSTETYSNNNWWPVVVLIGVSFLLFGIAFYLNTIRDWDAGFIQARPGKKEASGFLKTPIGLAFRIQRTAFIAWSIGLFILGVSYGSVMGDLESFFQGNELLEELLIAEEGYSLTEQFIPMLMLVMAILATIPPIMVINKLIGEERKNRIEPILSKAVSRYQLMGSYLILAIFNGWIMLSLTAAGLWVAADAVMEDSFSFSMIYEAGIVYFPAILVFVGLATFLIGILPRASSMIWIYLIYSFVINYLGGLLDFPEWLTKTSPFGYIPALPVEDMEWLPVITLIIIAIILIGVGLFGYRNRDVEG
jgi:ABC-2 type transport system permease protein